MAIELQEYVGAVFVETKAEPMKLSEGYTQTYMDEASLMVDIEAIHSIITRNDTLYTPQCIKDSVPLWTNPYERPVIMHHKERDGITIGRVKSAKYIDKSQRSETAALELTVNIGDEEGKKGVKNGTLATVSIGAIAHDIRCSICGTNLVDEGMCEHDKGEFYDNKKCYWIVNKIEPKEISYVIVPSDIYAHNTRVYDAVKKNKNNEVKENMTNIFADLIKEHNLTESTTSTKEGTVVDETVKKDAEKVSTTSAPEEPKKPEEEPKTEPEQPKTEPEAKTEEPKEPEQPKEEPKTEPEEPKEGEKSKEGEEEGEPEKTEEPKDNKELEDAKAEIAELKKEVASLTAEKEKLAKQVANEKTLKESAEAELLTIKKKEKATLVENINSLRAKLSLPAEDIESLMENSNETLELTIKNLNEFSALHKKSVAGLSVLESPVAVSEEKDNTNSEKIRVNDVKESKEDSNIDLEASLLNIFSSLL